MRRPLAAAISLAVLLVGAAVGVGAGLVPVAADAAVSSSRADSGSTAVIDAAARPVVVDDSPNEADMQFATMMIPHHQQALELSRILAATPGISDTSIGLAAFIERDQGAEIVQMQGWLDAWHQAGVMDHEHAGTMAGMATAEQIASLDARESVAAEKSFLELMITHHEGALEMARTVMSAGRNSFIRALAKHVAAEQQREIEAMTARLGLL